MIIWDFAQSPFRCIYFWDSRDVLKFMQRFEKKPLRNQQNVNYQQKGLFEHICCKQYEIFINVSVFLITQARRGKKGVYLDFFCLFSGVPWWMEAKVENNKMYKNGIENGGKGGKNLNQISEKDQLITWREKCSHTEAVLPYCSGQLWRRLTK